MRFGSSYFRNDVSGLGADDQVTPSFADQALLTLLGPTPSLVYTEWATQTGDISWNEVIPANDYQAYAVNDLQLVSVANSTSSEVSTLAVISPVLTHVQIVQSAFEGTPFAYDHTEAIYSQLDQRTPPQIYFLYWLKLRDPSDPKTGPTSLNYAATMVAGVLSYIVQIPPAPTDRAHPASGTFLSVLGVQTAQGPIAIPATPAAQATLPAPAPAPVPVIAPATQASLAPSASDNVKALLWVGLGTAAAIGAFKLIQGRKGGAS